MSSSGGISNRQLNWWQEGCVWLFDKSKRSSLVALIYHDGLKPTPPWVYLSAQHVAGELFRKTMAGNSQLLKYTAMSHSAHGWKRWCANLDLHLSSDVQHNCRRCPDHPLWPFQEEVSERNVQLSGLIHPRLSSFCSLCIRYNVFRWRTDRLEDIQLHSL